MKAYQLPAFGIDNLRMLDIDEPSPGPGEVLVRLAAASINYRDFMIAEGQFAPPEALPIIPLSDGAGEVVAVGDGVSRVAVGERVTPTFFPRWLSGDALGDERALSIGLEAAGCLQQFGIFSEQGLVKVAAHLTDAEAACLPCAGVTAWSALFTVSNVQKGDWVLVLGTGGVSIFALQFAKAIGAQVIVTSSSDAKLKHAVALGADQTINYTAVPEWGQAAKELTGGRGVDCVVEVGGSGTLAQSLNAVRRGGHVPIIGALAGAPMDILVYNLIMTNAHLHGIGVGNRDAHEAMMQFIATHELAPVIDQEFAFDDAPAALRAIDDGRHFGKLVVNI